MPTAAYVGRTIPEIAEGREPGAREEAERVEDACRVVVETGQPFLNLGCSGLAGSRSRQWLCSIFPIAAPDRSVRGLLAAITDATYDRERERALAHARDDAERAVRRLQRLLEVTEALSQARTAEDVMSVLALQADRAFGVYSVAAYVLRGDALELVSAMGPAGESSDRIRRIPLDSPYPAATAAREREAIWLETPHAIATRFPQLVQLAPYAARFGAMAALPLRAGDTILGSVGFGFANPGAFPPEERELLAAAAEQCAIALDRARLLDAEREARAAEARSRALLDAVVENAPIGIGFLDRDLRFRRLNQLLADLDGLAVEEHLGKAPREILPGLPMDEMEEAWREILRTGRPLLDVEVAGETPAAPGKRRTWLESWYPVRSGDETLGIGALVREVTAEREAEEFQRNVLGIVGHDLRTPLSALANAAHLLSRADDLPPERLRLAARIVANAARMERIISVLVDYARARARQGLPLHRRPCDLSSLAEMVADECEAAHPGREIRRTGTGDPTGEWDPDRIAQVLANIVSNAVDYSPPGTAVDVAWRNDGETVVLEIANDGPPIPPEVLPRLFEPFRRAERQRAGGKDGLGLGLFIASAIVAAHGGSIEARSAPGERTTFTVRLPREP